jgi:hypothetical protein
MVGGRMFVERMGESMLMGGGGVGIVGGKTVLVGGTMQVVQWENRSFESADSGLAFNQSERTGGMVILSPIL